MTETINELKIVHGDAVSMDIFSEGFNRGFAGYKYGAQFTPEQMQTYLDHSGVHVSDCSVLVTQEPPMSGVGIALLALYDHSAWCGGLAVAPPYRRLGYASKLMDSIEARAKECGANCLYLEVLTENAAALRLYERLGYQLIRNLQIWQRAPVPPPTSPASRKTETVISIHDGTNVLRQIEDDTNRERPAWQRTPHFILNTSNNLTTWTLSDRAGRVSSYVVARHTNPNGDAAPQLRIADIGWLPDHNSAQYIADMLQFLSDTFPDSNHTLLNEPENSQISAHLAQADFQVVETQFEMVKELT